MYAKLESAESDKNPARAAKHPITEKHSTHLSPPTTHPRRTRPTKSLISAVRNGPLCSPIIQRYRYSSSFPPGSASKIRPRSHRPSPPVQASKIRSSPSNLPDQSSSWIGAQDPSRYVQGLCWDAAPTSSSATQASKIPHGCPISPIIKGQPQTHNHSSHYQ